MGEKILDFLLAISIVYAWGYLSIGSLIFLTSLSAKAKSTKKKTENPNIAARARALLLSDTEVRKTFIALRLLHLKNKHNGKMHLLEQKMRVLVREKAVRQEIIHMVRAKCPK